MILEILQYSLILMTNTSTALYGLDAAAAN